MADGNPLRHIEDAKKIIEQRAKARAGISLEHRGAMAAEEISDELTMMRAELSAIREQLGIISGHVAGIKIKNEERGPAQRALAFDLDQG
jgi:hypothetical protein